VGKDPGKFKGNDEVSSRKKSPPPVQSWHLPLSSASACELTIPFNCMQWKSVLPFLNENSQLTLPRGKAPATIVDIQARQKVTRGGIRRIDSAMSIR
jgi:hypothetical protein